MSDGRTAIILGASGLVGANCLGRLCADSLYRKVVVITRRELEHLAGTQKIIQVVVDFDRLSDWSGEIVGDDVFCTFGTTIKKAGSRDRFRKIDLDYPAQLAHIARHNGARHFSLVSSRGADPASRVFYLRTKGELEQSVVEQDWPSVGIFRPSVIGGQRTETRAAESVAQRLLRFAPRGIRTVSAASIASAMLHVATERRPGVRIVESRDLLDY